MKNSRFTTPFEMHGMATPTTDAVLRQHTWTSPDTISDLADLYYGDWRLWRIIARKNNIEDVRKIEPGTVLTIPQKPLEKGRYVSG